MIAFIYSGKRKEIVSERRLQNQGLSEASKQIISDLENFHKDLVKTFAKDKSLAKSNDYRRSRANDFLIEHAGKIEEVAGKKDFEIRSVIDLHSIPVRLYYRDLEIKSRDLVIFIHGGGWFQGNLETHDYICRKLVKFFKRDVLAIDYRLTPEHVFPVQLNDVLSAYLWSSCELKYERIILAGDSAGGNLCAALCMKLAENEKIVKPHAQILFYPALGNNLEGGSVELFENCPALSKASVLSFITKYTGPHGAYDNMAGNKFVYPILEDDMSIFPTTVVVSASYDILLDSQLEFVNKFRHCRDDILHFVENGAVHGFMSYGKYFDDVVDRTLEKIKEYLRAIDNLNEKSEDHSAEQE